MKLSSSIKVGDIMEKVKSQFIQYTYYQFNNRDFEKVLMTMF